MKPLKQDLNFLLFRNTIPIVIPDVAPTNIPFFHPKTRTTNIAIMFLIVSMSANSNILSAIDGSIITKFMYQNNILLNIIF